MPSPSSVIFSAPHDLLARCQRGGPRCWSFRLTPCASGVGLYGHHDSMLPQMQMGSGSNIGRMPAGHQAQGKRCLSPCGRADKQSAAQHAQHTQRHPLLSVPSKALFSCYLYWMAGRCTKWKL